MPHTPDDRFAVSVDGSGLTQNIVSYSLQGRNIISTLQTNLDGMLAAECFLSDAQGRPLDPLIKGSIMCQEIPQTGGRQNVNVLLPNGETVTLQKVKVLKKGFVMVQVTCLRGICQTPPIPFQVVEKFFLCAPPGTTLQCEITDFECDVNLTCDANRNFQQLDIWINMCQEVQMEALVKLEIEASFCEPRREILVQCPPQRFPEQCPAIFAPTTESDLNELTLAQPNEHNVDAFNSEAVPISGAQQETLCIKVPKVYDWVARQVDVPLISLRSGEVNFTCRIG